MTTQEDWKFIKDLDWHEYGTGGRKQRTVPCLFAWPVGDYYQKLIGFGTRNDKDDRARWRVFTREPNTNDVGLDEVLIQPTYFMYIGAIEVIPPKDDTKKSELKSEDDNREALRHSINTLIAQGDLDYCLQNRFHLNLKSTPPKTAVP